MIKIISAILIFTINQDSLMYKTKGKYMGSLQKESLENFLKCVDENDIPTIMVMMETNQIFDVKEGLVVSHVESHNDMIKVKLVILDKEIEFWTFKHELNEVDIKSER